MPSPLSAAALSSSTTVCGVGDGIRGMTSVNIKLMTPPTTFPRSSCAFSSVLLSSISACFCCAMVLRPAISSKSFFVVCGSNACLVSAGDKPSAFPSCCLRRSAERCEIGSVSIPKRSLI